MSATFWIVILVVAAGVMVVYGAQRIPSPFSWLLIGVYVVIVLVWLAHMLGLP